MTSVFARQARRPRLSPIPALRLAGLSLALGIVCLSAQRPGGHPAAEQPPKPSAAPDARAALAAAVPLDAQDLEGFLEGLVPAELERDDIAGAALSVVKEGRLLFARGYGYADFDRRTPVRAAATLFKVASISKLFTWVGVLQLEEQGRIDLDADVNRYLDFTIPATFPEPITLRDLMTQRPGFAETTKDLLVGDPDDIGPLSAFLKTHLPRRMYPPGSTPAYSNYGATLAGYVVQRVSGEAFTSYVEHHILEPLHMEHSTFVQPLPSPLAPLMSRAYAQASAGPKPLEYLPAPAGGLATTATDMANFMIAELGAGQFGDERILQPDTVERMQARQVAVHPALNGMGLGFIEESRNGRRIIGHRGDVKYVQSMVQLIPDANVGVYMAFNSRGRPGSLPRDIIWARFLDRYFPDTPRVLPTVANAASDARAVAGRYLTSQRADHTLARLGYLLDEVSVSPGPDGTVVIDPWLGVESGGERPWREIAPGVYRHVHGQETVVFRGSGHGGKELAGDIPIWVFQRVSGLEDERVLVPFIAGILGIFALTVLLWPIAALARRHYGYRLAMVPGELRLRRWVRVVCTLDLAFLGAYFALRANVEFFTSRLDPWLHLLQVLGYLGALGVVLAVLNAWWSWRSTTRRWTTRLHDTLMALACLGFVWIAYAMNLLDWTLRY
jgi:CubicO group peptidase (beta-lactamase class C family)